MMAKNPYSHGRSNPHGEDPFIGDPMGGLGDFQNPHNPIADEYRDLYDSLQADHAANKPSYQNKHGYPNKPQYRSGQQYKPKHQGLPGFPTGMDGAESGHSGYSGHGRHGLAASSAVPGYPSHGSQNFDAMRSSSRNSIVAAVLAVFLGTLGVHNFYLGYQRRAKWQLGLTIFGWATSILLIGIPILLAVYIWSMVEFIMILLGAGPYFEDGDGYPLL